MFAILLVSVTFAIVVSACCSLMEAALYAVPLPHIKHLAESGKKSGKRLLKLKESIEKPISAILILNTIANTAGASLAGWAYGQLYGQCFGEFGILLFSVVFILCILIFSEIIPKIIGVEYSRQVAPLIAPPLTILLKILAGPIRLSQFMSARLKPDDEVPAISHEEVLSMAALGTEEGALDDLEGSVIANVIGLDELLVRDVLTPRVVVFRLEETARVKDVESQLASWNFTRVPLYSEDEPDHLTAYVTQRDIYRELLAGNKECLLKQLGRPLQVVPELMRVDKLLLKMFEEREHICSVVDEYGGLAGIITLEDIIEEIVGREIVDEYDPVSDLRTFAKILKVTRERRRKSVVRKRGK